MKKMFPALPFFLTSLILLTVSCQKETHEDVDLMQQMIVPNGFDYTLNREITLTVELPSTIHYGDRKKGVIVYDDLPVNGGSQLESGAADQNGIFSTILNIPATQSSLYIRSFAGWKELPLSIGMKTLNDSYSVNYNEDYFNEPPDTTPEFRPVSGYGIHTGIPALKSGGNFVGNAGFEENDFGTQLYWSSAMKTDQRWYISDNLKGSFQQVRAGDSQVLEIAPNSNQWGGVTQLISVEPGEEVTFTADMNIISNTSSRVWIYLIPRDVNQRPFAYYSRLLSGTGWQTQTVTATMPAAAVYCQVLFWSHNPAGSRIQYDNAVVGVKGRITDSDGDGVDDDEDQYPNDPNKAFNSFYPGENKMGTLAFEDLWPNAGDYDFNDLVVGYKFNHIRNANNLITSMAVNFEIRAIGASIQNGFGFELDVSRERISRVTNYYAFNSSEISLSENGTESGNSKASIIVFDNAFDLLAHPGTGLGINTNPDLEYVDPYNLRVEIDFDEGLRLQDIGNAPNNPFIFRTNNRGWEIHLPGYRPTDLADESKFGTGDDATHFETEHLYKTAKGLPWGMNLPVTFVYPIEKSPIIKAHLKFQQWAVSGGYSFMDWYEDHEGYRDPSRLYLLEQ